MDCSKSNVEKTPNFRHFWSTLTENAFHKAITQVRKVGFQFGQNSDDLECATINYRPKKKFEKLKKNLVHSPFKSCENLRNMFKHS